MSEWTYPVLFAIAAVFGLRGSIRLTQRYHDVREQLEWREGWILLLLALVSWTITLAAGYYGFLSVRTVLGFPRIEGIAPVSAIIAIAVLFLPTLIDAVVDRVARVPWK